jgi:hypothetical protein
VEFGVACMMKQFVLILLLPDNDDETILQNFGNYSYSDTASHPRHLELLTY